ncbi:DUF4136 domain-containing protein [Algoriphagus sp. CAU 1675]|uniref:DUF4136 domain-containing protein n=1 Tax=Algoriphagus sp. CAU 1675 TaxID=3032597 RepID=UPI0023D9E226|nr:DUF4136 domain-containing protein [Algoriphagus sp. CAU 1675]MDF2157767.1 DUF4136 domain-containing protein [Algoriphagus sp. CAU 1675]
MKNRLVPLLSIWVLFSCSSIDIFKENSEIPLTRNYQSFVIINEEIGMRGFSSPMLDEKIQEYIRYSLETQGMVYDKTKPDLVIRYTSNEDPRKREISSYSTPYPFWGYRIYDPWMFNPYSRNSFYNRRTSEYELLQVIVDFIDPAKDKFLMTLTGVTEVSSPKYKEKKVLKTTEKIIERFVLETRTTPYRK